MHQENIELSNKVNLYCQENMELHRKVPLPNYKVLTTKWINQYDN